MASGTEVGVDGGAEASSGRQKWAESKVYTRKSFKGLKSHNKNNDSTAQEPAEALAPAPADVNSPQKQLVPHLNVVADDSPAQIMPPVAEEVSGNAAPKEGSARQENGVKLNLGSRPKKEMRDLRRKLEIELDLVRTWVKKIEGKEAQMTSGGVDNGGAKRVQPKVVASGGPPRGFRPLHQLSISVLENSQGTGENVEKEKRTPKANQFYRNSEFLLAKDKFPPLESNRKSKSNAKKQGSGDSGFGLGKFSNQVFRSCNTLLDKLLKHKHGWVFSKPVDAESLGLHDYFDIIKHPMDLGTVKTRLSKNWYKSPREFAEDVRLTFSNAMVYNPPGQDVHVMAQQLSELFEDKWAVIEADYMRELRLAVNYEVGLPTPTSRKAPSLVSPSAEMRRNLDRSESMTNPLKPMNFVLPGRSTAPKKPKARDPHKRDMTYDEKEKLSTSLQDLPSDKQRNIIQIIKKRNTSLSQKDDEIEVDIDSVDIETLWELDRFVTNYKKNVNKNKRKAELTSEATPEGRPTTQEKNQELTTVEPPKEANSGQKNVASQSPIDLENQGDKVTKSSSSSSSSSDSGSSSSDSDSESSSRSGSDAPNSPAAK